VSGWSTTAVPDGSWSDASKTANDPCPSGYRVPSKAQWDGVIANNTITDEGAFSNGATNYSAGKNLGDNLMLPVAGLRSDVGGGLIGRGVYGYYWSSTVTVNSLSARGLYLYPGGTLTYTYSRTYGFPVRCIEEYTGSVGAVNCSGATITGTLRVDQAASGVSASVPYTGGNAGPHSGQTVTSTGVTGLTATLASGNFVSESGSLSYAITGTPSAAGTATFALNIGGKTCSLEVTVAAGPPVCRAKVDAVNYKNFMCYNLGAANTSADPFTPSWEIIGGYWQWGRLAQAVAGPAGPDAGQANDGAVSGWITTYAPDGSWSDASKTANDPCPSGYRIPTKAQWEGVVANNTITSIGTSSDSATNYSSGIKFGTNLFLPNAGKRKYNNGALEVRGSYGYYWSSSASSTNSGLAGYLRFVSTLTTVNFNDRAFGFSVRCIAQ
jgi:uncharacterized protein (TIGR02145 family)